MRRRRTEVLGPRSLDLDPGMPVSDLSIGEQKMVEIARALSMNRGHHQWTSRLPALGITKHDGRTGGSPLAN